MNLIDIEDLKILVFGIGLVKVIKNVFLIKVIKIMIINMGNV